MVHLIKDIDLFYGAGDSFFKGIEKQAHSMTVNKGQVLFSRGEEAESLYFIKSGWIKLFRETLDGTQSVIDILTSGHTFGEAAIFENHTYPYSAEVVESAEIISIPLGALKKEMEENHTLALNMLKSMARYRRHQDQEIEHLSIQNAPQRIGCFLLRLVKQDSQGPITIHLPYDKVLVASRLGMQPETFSRALGKLKDKTGIKVKGATIEIDSIDQLVGYSCAACSSEFPCRDL